MRKPEIQTTSTNPIDVIREALERCIMRLTAHGENNTNFAREAIVALAEVEARYVPELPEGWRISSVHKNGDGTFTAWLKHGDDEGSVTINGYGPTINAACKAAVERIKT